MYDDDDDDDDDGSSRNKAGIKFLQRVTQLKEVLECWFMLSTGHGGQCEIIA